MNEIIDGKVVTTIEQDLASFINEKKNYLEQLEREESEIKLRKEAILKELESLIP